MKRVFADSVYWVAVTRPRDPWAKAARAAKLSIREARIITTDEVLIEFLAMLSGGGKNIRRQAANIVYAILSDPDITVIPQSRQSFLAGLQLYRQRDDKEYSLVDCISMNAMRAESLTEILSCDHHFEQEGFTIVMRK